MKRENLLHQRRPSVGWLLTIALAWSAWAIGCRVDDPSCTSHAMCDDGEVCGSTGVCEPRIERQQARRELFHRFGADISGYRLWAQYGTAGARHNRADTLSAMPPVHAEEQTSTPRASSHMHERDDDAPIYRDEVGDKNADLKTAPHSLCALGDVRTDDLTFKMTRAYPGGYWGDTAIADTHNGRCGDDLETLAWRLLNCERISRDIEPVDCDLRLVWISRQHADDMASRDFFDHINPDGHDSFHRLAGRGIDYGIAGENLARHTSIYDAHLAWMRSSLHRRNILTEQYQYAGIGVISAGKQLFLTETFLGGVKDNAQDMPPPAHRPPPLPRHDDVALD